MPPHTAFPLPQALHPKGKGAAVENWRGQEFGAHLSSAQSSHQERLLQAAWQRNEYLPTQRASVEPAKANSREEIDGAWNKGCLYHPWRPECEEPQEQRGLGWENTQPCDLPLQWHSTGRWLCVLVLLLHRSASPNISCSVNCSIGQIKALRTAQTATVKQSSPAFWMTHG